MSRQDSILAPVSLHGLAHQFEHGDPTQRVRLVLAELLHLQTQIAEYNQNKINSPNSEIIFKSSELFDNDVYLEEISDIICICLAELPVVFNITDVCETLLYVNKGPSIICWVVANMPDTFREGNFFSVIIYAINQSFLEYFVFSGEPFSMERRTR